MDYIKSQFDGKTLRLEYLQDVLGFTTTSYILNHIQKLISTTNAGAVVLDIGNVQHIDSSAVGMFISVKHEMMKHNRSFLLQGLTENVRRILHILDVDQFLNAA
jgi:anti-anti-sigma factor